MISNSSLEAAPPALETYASINYGDRTLRQPRHKHKKLVKEYQRLINGVQRLVDKSA
ncbi:hypothetical protein [Nostoc sp.]|uniref:hypothetical protein n=1 Tax=Nostoc sp. TaxID=1180 RepID=UPI002FFB4DFA